jgi:hypothetical protein
MQIVIGSPSGSTTSWYRRFEVLAHDGMYGEDLYYLSGEIQDLLVAKAKWWNSHEVIYGAETTMTVEHKDGSKYRYSETDPIYGEMGEIVGHVSEITDEQDTPYQKIYGRDVTREHNFHLNHAETFEPHRDSKGRFAEKPLLTGSVISGLALGLIYLMRGK